VALQAGHLSGHFTLTGGGTLQLARHRRHWNTGTVPRYADFALQNMRRLVPLTTWRGTALVRLRTGLDTTGLTPLPVTRCVSVADAAVTARLYATWRLRRIQTY